MEVVACMVLIFNVCICTCILMSMVYFRIVLHINSFNRLNVKIIYVKLFNVCGKIRNLFVLYASHYIGVIICFMYLESKVYAYIVWLFKTNLYSSTVGTTK